MTLEDAVLAAREAARDDTPPYVWAYDRWVRALQDRVELRNGVAYYDPYQAAIAYLMDPAAVQQRSQGGMAETYLDLKDLVAYLREESKTLRARWPEAVVDLNLELDIRGWG